MTHEPESESESEIDELIARYRADLAAEAELARGDLDEIEDHLRSLVADLREHGTPLAEAVALASRRLGEPRQLAREHARVRTPFGARLSRARAWSAAALLLLPIALYSDYDLSRGPFTITSLHLVVWLGLLAALGARRPWARALVVGVLATSVLVQAIHIFEVMDARDMLDRLRAVTIRQATFERALFVRFVASLAALALVAPWRRGELSSRGVALALLGPAYLGAVSSLHFYLDLPHAFIADPHGTFAFAAAIVAMAAVLRDAPWASLAAAVAACALGVLAHTALVGDTYVYLDLRWAADDIGRVALLGAVCALGASITLWRGRLRTVRNAVS